MPTGAETVLTAQTGPDTLGELHLPVVDGELAFEEGSAETASLGGPRSASSAP